MAASDFRNLVGRVRLKAWNLSLRLAVMQAHVRGQDPYSQLVRVLHRRLRIPKDYHRRGLRFYREASDLVAVPCGPGGTVRLMSSAIRQQWEEMQVEAAAAGITLIVRSAFRNADEQALFIREQLAAGGKIEDLLTWIAAPGYSEHHTGRALDLDSEPAADDFEDTAAFRWLCGNASRFGFRMSYQRDNVNGIAYEPWHWFCADPGQK